MLIKLATKSLLDRKGSVALTCIAMTISIFVLLGVEHIRKEAKDSFSSTVSGTDLIVGARSGSLNLLLYSVFRMGSATNNISWASYQDIANRPEIDWTIPISLGDSHQGYRVLGTNNDYFQHFSYGRKQLLKFAQGGEFKGIYDVVLGSEVAAELAYQLGDPIIISHGIGETSFNDHSQYPFKIIGVLAATGTPVDQTVHVQLEGIEAIHDSPSTKPAQLQPNSITAFLVGLKSRISTFSLQREISEKSGEALSAILPGVALSELWNTMAILEGTLQLVSSLVFVAALLGLTAMMAASIRERKKEFELLRIVGASPSFLFVLFQVEALLIALLSIASAMALLYLCLLFAQNQISSQLGLHFGANFLSTETAIIALIIIVATMVLAALPAFQAYVLVKKKKP